MADFQDALSRFNRDKSAWYGWKKVDEDGNRIPDDQRMTYENIELLDPTATIPSKAEIDAKLKEMEWLENRRSEYPSMGDQLDMLWHAIDDGTLDKTSTFYTSLKATKDKYPKT